MEIKPFNEWVLENPGKNINDYYVIYGKARMTSNMTANNLSHASYPDFKPVNTIVNIRIAPWRLFVYTGIVMASTILWVLIFLLLPIIMFGGHIFKDLITKMFGG